MGSQGSMLRRWTRSIPEFHPLNEYPKREFPLPPPFHISSAHSDFWKYHQDHHFHRWRIRPVTRQFPRSITSKVCTFLPQLHSIVANTRNLMPARTRNSKLPGQKIPLFKFSVPLLTSCIDDPDNAVHYWSSWPEHPPISHVKPKSIPSANCHKWTYSSRWLTHSDARSGCIFRWATRYS